jgi:thymidylate kinase
VGVELNREQAAAMGRKLFVILDGPDCAGKTTLTAQLSDFFQVQVEKHIRIEDRNAMLGNIAHKLAYANPEKTGKGIILDRWQFPTDIIYERLNNRQLSPFQYIMPLIAESMHRHNVLILHVTAHIDVLLARLRSRGDEEIDTEQLSCVADLYDLFFATYTELPTQTIDTSFDTPDEVFAMAVETIVAHYSKL